MRATITIYVFTSVLMVTLLAGCQKVELEAQRSRLLAKDAELKSLGEELKQTKSLLESSRNRATEIELKHAEAIRNLESASQLVESLRKQLEEARSRRDAAVKLLTESSTATALPSPAPLESSPAKSGETPPPLKSNDDANAARPRLRKKDRPSQIWNRAAARPRVD